ncbi:glutamine amidotransferase [Nanchangia anserum]|uniref:Glutamine amidotransferase n=1 Tax=Nanchangia anserum TaxID=2692125 RepID=A0A8I0GD67_9ACTO|nr:glutamine amidotransferase [Nanchangia anserum]MBD3689831.1 glutamine amidotransferase [Nanchangia anserum]QOX82001.1 glutamine amidotransferase [Nanchangia anserum]
MCAAKPFLLISTRSQPEILASEYDVFQRFTGLEPSRLIHYHLDRDPLVTFAPDRWAGIILCGSPYNSLKPEGEKDPVQIRVEADISRLLDQLVPIDFPFLGVCYGVGTLLAHQGGVVSQRYAEEISAPEISLTDEGRADPLMQGLPQAFRAYVGHTEAAETLPESAVLLASSPSCPIQLFRVGHNMYGTQFHPELDWPALYIRILEYASAGYYPPTEQRRIIESCEAANVGHVHRILANFVKIYG